MKIVDVIRNTSFIRVFGFFKIPLLFYLRPTVVELNDSNCEIKIPLSRRSKNHLNSMYFAALAAGADLAGGLVAMKKIMDSKRKVSLVFQEFHASFYKRAESDVFFQCDQVQEIKELVNLAISTKERQKMDVKVKAFCPDKFEEPVAEFTLLLSLKLRE